MSLTKVLVLDSSTGKFRQNTSADTLDAIVNNNNSVSLTNDNASAITIGMAVYVSASGHVDKARANAAGTTGPIGLVAAASIAAAAAGAIQTSGVLSSPDWTAVIGSSTLTPNTDYFLDNATAGKMTATPPTSGYNVLMGKAISTTDFYIDIETEIKL